MESAKKCVTTYLPNESAPKMDGAQVCLLIPDRLENFNKELETCRRALRFLASFLRGKWPTRCEAV